MLSRLLRRAPAARFLGGAAVIGGAGALFAASAASRTPPSKPLTSTIDKPRSPVTHFRVPDSLVTPEHLLDRWITMQQPDPHQRGGIFAIWEMFDKLPSAQRQAITLIKDKGPDAIALDYRHALATLNASTFYKVAPLLLPIKEAPDSSCDRTFFRERHEQHTSRQLLYLLRDVHDEHDCDYKSPYATWTGKFNSTRGAVEWLVERLPPEVLDGDKFLASEVERILDPHMDYVDRGMRSAPEMHKLRKAAERV